MVATPGPANLLMMTATSQHGFRRMIPFLLGLVTGALIINLGISFGLIHLINQSNLAWQLLTIFSTIYMLYLAIQGWHPAKQKSNDTPSLAFFSGLFVHPLNPKNWLMATLAATQFAIHYDGDFARFWLVPLSFLVIQLCFHSLWGLAGVLLQHNFSKQLWLQRSLVVLTIFVIIWALWQSP